MKKLVLLLSMLAPTLAIADGYVVGAGRWTCAEVVRIGDGGTDIEVGQLTGWVLGFWSAATFTADTAFIDIVENVGGRAILDATVDACRKAPTDAMLFQVSQSMIRNTG